MVSAATPCAAPASVRGAPRLARLWADCVAPRHLSVRSCAPLRNSDADRACYELAQVLRPLGTTRARAEAWPGEAAAGH